MTSNQPAFSIGNVPIDGDLILAPMDGVSDMPFRGLCRQLGSAMSVTEFINALDVLEGNPRYKHRLAFKPYHRPLSLQMLGDEPDQILMATQQLVTEIQPDIIDINLGCQSKNVTSRGAGATLMNKPQVVADIIRTMTDHFTVPITAKIRLGWDEDHLNYLDIAKIIQDNGGAMVAVHGRTRKQAYRGKARWDPIREIKETLDIPVIGNGNVQTLADIQRIKAETNCDAVMIGRGAVGNPWIFSRMDRKDVPDELVFETIHQHLHAILDFYGERGIITFRKYLKAYLQPYGLTPEQLRTLLTSKDPDFILEVLERDFDSRFA